MKASLETATVPASSGENLVPSCVNQSYTQSSSATWIPLSPEAYQLSAFLEWPRAPPPSPRDDGYLEHVPAIFPSFLPGDEWAEEDPTGRFFPTLHLLPISIESNKVAIKGPVDKEQFPESHALAPTCDPLTSTFGAVSLVGGQDVPLLDNSIPAQSPTRESIIGHSSLLATSYHQPSACPTKPLLAQDRKYALGHTSSILIPQHLAASADKSKEEMTSNTW